MLTKAELLNALTRTELLDVVAYQGIEVPELRGKAHLVEALLALPRIGICEFVQALEWKRRKDLGVDVLRFDSGELVEALRDNEFRGCR